MADSSNSQPIGPQPPLPGKGLFGWFGRQLGYVARAIKHEPAGPQTVFRARMIQEQTLEQDPDVKLRRTTIDEVIVKQKAVGHKGT